MGISLSNHEDRIKKLESDSSYTPTEFKVDILFNNPVTCNNGQMPLSLPVSTVSKYPFLVVVFTGWEAYASLTSITTTVSVAVILKKLKWYATEGYGGSRYSETEGFVIEMSGSNVNFVCQTGNTTSLMYVYGLKLYYNFSYNIYRLANSISFHFFKCLIKIRN